MNLDKTNLLKETIEALKHGGKRIGEVNWVGSDDGVSAISWYQFAKLASDVVYNGASPDGGPVIAANLVVVGDGWWLEREGDDWPERWVMKTQPVRSQSPRTIADLREPASLLPCRGRR